MTDSNEARFSVEMLRQLLATLAKPELLQIILPYLPGGNLLHSALAHFDQRQVKSWLAVIDAMTPDERDDPMVIDNVRLNRLVSGSGVPRDQVVDILVRMERMAEAVRERNLRVPREKLVEAEEAQRQSMEVADIAGERLARPRLEGTRIHGPNGELVVFEWTASSQRIEPGDHLFLKGRVTNASECEFHYYDSARPQLYVFSERTDEWWSPETSATDPSCEPTMRFGKWKAFRERTVSFHIHPHSYWRRHDLSEQESVVGLPAGHFQIGCEMKFEDHGREFVSDWIAQGVLRPKPIAIEVV